MVRTFDERPILCIYAKTMTKKIAIIVQGGNDKFLAPIRDWFESRFEVRIIKGNNRDKIQEALNWADLTWVEWVQKVAVDVSKMERKGKLVMRLHSFEAYTSLPAMVHWQKVDALLVVAPHVVDILSLRIANITDLTKIFILPNCIDTDKFTIPASKQKTGKIAFVGQIRHTKNLPLVLQCFASAHRIDPTLTLHLAGEYDGGELEVMELALYINHITHAMNLSGAVILHKQVEDIATWLADKDALISASIRESFGYNIGEAMASGVRPAIHNFPGAGSIFPEELIFNTVDQCRDILLANTPSPQDLRAYALKSWPLKLQMAKLAELTGMMLG
jgi:glycosyltransferase involved in cell wall biosynthesis